MPPAPGRIAELEAQLARTTAILRELDHRIKNDLQLIASVFVLQGRRLPPGPQRDAIREALARVNAVSAVHRRLDPVRDPARLQAADLVRDLVADAASEAGREDIRVEFDLPALSIPARQAAPLALIVSELIRNALTHGFPDRGGAVAVALGASDGAIQLAIRDDGVGMPEGAGSGGGFGIALVGLLAQQLRGKFEIGGARPGVRAVVRFPQAD